MTKAERTPSLADRKDLAREEIEAAIDQLESASARAATAARQLRSLLDEEARTARWLPLKGAAREYGLSEKTMRTMAMRAGSLRMLEGRVYVDTNALPTRPLPKVSVGKRALPEGKDADTDD